jgi:hypothetical protein
MGGRRHGAAAHGGQPWRMLAQEKGRATLTSRPGTKEKVQLEKCKTVSSRAPNIATS